jgi:hypothetical protein
MDTTNKPTVLLEVFLEVVGVELVLDFWLDWRLDLEIADFLPID